MQVRFIRRFAFALCLGLWWASAAHAQTLRIGVGNPIAGGAPQAKASVFVVRTEGCAAPGESRMTAIAEGLVNHARQSVPVRLTAMPTPGVYAVSRVWPSGGVWVVNLTTTCQTQTAGAIVPVGPSGFLRDQSKFFPRPAVPADIDAALNALAGNGGIK